MKSVKVIASLGLVLLAVETSRAEVPLMSKEKLKERSSLIVVGQIREIYTATSKSASWIDSKSVAEVRVINVEKGQLGDGRIVYAHFWNKRWIGKGNPPPGSNGHHVGAQKGDFVRVHLAAKDGATQILLPNGLAKLGKAPVKTAIASAAPKLDGVWRFVFYVEKGEPVKTSSREFAIKGDRLDFRVNGATHVETKIEIDRSKSPHQFTQRFENGQVYRSIFTQAGDYLVLCGNRSAPRPTKFPMGDDQAGEFLIVLKREN